MAEIADPLAADAEPIRFFPELRRCLGELGVGESFGAGTFDLAFSYALLAPHQTNDLGIKIVEYGIADPAGAALGLFGLACLAHGIKTMYRNHFPHRA